MMLILRKQEGPGTHTAAIFDECKIADALTETRFVARSRLCAGFPEATPAQPSRILSRVGPRYSLLRALMGSMLDARRAGR
jgi:hypothetical protein